MIDRSSPGYHGLRSGSSGFPRLAPAGRFASTRERHARALLPRSNKAIGDVARLERDAPRDAEGAWAGPAPRAARPLRRTEICVNVYEEPH